MVWSLCIRGLYFTFYSNKTLKRIFEGTADKRGGIGITKILKITVGEDKNGENVRGKN